MSHVDNLADLIQAYLDTEEAEGVYLIEVNRSLGAELDGPYETVDEALRSSMEEYREFTERFVELWGEVPALPEWNQFIVGEGRLERTITFREPADDESRFPVMLVSDPSTGKLEAVTAESVPSNGI